MENKEMNYWMVKCIAGLELKCDKIMLGEA